MDIHFSFLNILRGLAADKTVVIKASAKGSQSLKTKSRTKYYMMSNSMTTYSMILLKKEIGYLQVCIIIN